MTKLRAVAARVFIQSDPYVKRYPVFSESVYYQTGSVVSRSFQADDSDSDNVFYNFYVAKKDVEPRGLDPESSNSNWILWVSGDPKFKTFYTDSDVYDYIDKANDDYTKRFAQTDSDLSIVVSDIKDILGFDSEIKKIQEDIRDLQERNLIDSLIDSEAQHQKAIAWDSDYQRFKFITPVLSLNTVLPDVNGNVDYSFTTTKTGSRDDRLDSDVTGTIFIVVGDSDTTANGVTYSYANNAWVRLIGYTERENDARYINTAGDTMTGPLLLAGNPTLNNQAATKNYVDTFSDSDKQDKIIILDKDSDLQTATKFQDRIYYIKSSKNVWLCDNNVFRQFVIPGERVFDPVLLEARVTAIFGTFFDVQIRTYRFSDQLGGTLSLFRNNSLTPTIFNPSVNFTGVFNADAQYQNARLLDASAQTFIIRIPFTYRAFNTYRLDYYSHDGVLTSITVNGASNKVAFSDSNRIFNFGEY